jgi:hypothetical protein
MPLDQYSSWPTEIQLRAVEHFGMDLEVGVRAHADFEAFALSPLDEGQLPVGPPGRPGPPGEMVDLDVPDMRGVLWIGLAGSGHAAAFARRLV